MDKIQQLQQFVDESSYIVFFGGAGVSTESGIPDFRSTDGLYYMKYHYPPEQIISRSFFEKDPEEFYRFYRDKMLWPEAQPNPAHEKLAQLEQEGKLKAVITQNIDGLHQMAGSRRVLELHGTVHRNYCQKCGRLFGMSDILRSEGVPHCPCGGVIKPDVVLYEESLDTRILTQAVEEIARADLLIVAGTSLVVYPAAGLLDYFNGRHLVLINRTETGREGSASLFIQDSVGKVLSRLR